MRVVNDREEKTEPSELDIFGVLSHAMLSALSMMTVVLGPLAMILAERRLMDPLPKVSAVLGAMFALLFLKLPVPLVVISFVLGVFVADNIRREAAFWSLLGQSLLIAVGAAAGAVFFGAKLKGIPFFDQWRELISAFVSELQGNLHVSDSVPWEMMRNIFLFEGPFIYMALVILSLWFSIGLAAHLGWLDANKVYGRVGLRRIRLPVWFCMSFVGIVLALWRVEGPYAFLVSGLFRVAGAVMLIQGCVCLSEFLAFFVVRPRVKTLIYSLAIGIGFYALMGLAVVSPWFYRWKDSLSERLEEGK